MRRVKISLISLILLSLSLAYGEVPPLNPALYPYVTAIKTRITQVVSSLGLSEGQPEGIVRLRLCIGREGELKALQISESSGLETLDGLATRSVQKVFPFIPFPPEAKEPEVWIDMPVVLSKREKKGPATVAATPSGARPEVKKPRIEPQIMRAPLVYPPKLSEYIRIALANNLPTRIAQEQIDLSRLKINEAERSLYPSLSAEYKTSEGKTLTDPYESKSYGVQAEQLLLGLNQVYDALQREKLGLQMARINHAKLKNDLRYEVTKAYYELVSQKIFLKHWQDTLEDIKPELDLLQRLYDAGLVIAADFENAQSQHQLILYQITSSESNVSLAKLALLQAMNLETAQLEQIDVEPKFDFTAQDWGLDFGRCVDWGLHFRPEIALWQTACQSAKINEVIARRENKPKLSLLTSYGRSGEAYATQKLDMVEEWSLMGKLTWLWGPSSLEFSQTEDRTLPKNITDTTTKTAASTSDIKFSLMDKLNYYTTRKETKISYHQARSELNEARKKIIYEVKEAYLAYQRALAGIKTGLNRVEFRKNELEVIRARTQVGEGSPIELLEAKMNLANDKATYLRSLGEYYIALAALDKASGYQLQPKSTN